MNDYALRKDNRMEEAQKIFAVAGRRQKVVSHHPVVCVTSVTGVFGVFYANFD